MTIDTKACVACAEDIKTDALLCRFCGMQQDASTLREGLNQRQTMAGDKRQNGDRKSGLSTAFAFLVIGTVLGAATLIAIAAFSETDRLPQELTDVTPTTSPSLQSSAIDISEVYQKSLPSVVTVFCDDGFGSGFSYQLSPAAGYGSVIVTNEHVIAKCAVVNGPSVSMETFDGREVAGTLWAWDKEADMALIMIRQKIAPLTPGPEARIGDQVLVLGTPGGFQGTVTAGIISQVYSNAYQTDAAMNRGNSGGPLLDSEGRVLGVNTLGYGREGLNISFRIDRLCEKLVQCD